MDIGSVVDGLRSGPRLSELLLGDEVARGVGRISRIGSCWDSDPPGVAVVVDNQGQVAEDTWAGAAATWGSSSLDEGAFGGVEDGVGHVLQGSVE